MNREFLLASAYLSVMIAMALFIAMNTNFIPVGY